MISSVTESPSTMEISSGVMVLPRTSRSMVRSCGSASCVVGRSVTNSRPRPSTMSTIGMKVLPVTVSPSKEPRYPRGVGLSAPFDFHRLPVSAHRADEALPVVAAVHARAVGFTRNGDGGTASNVPAGLALAPVQDLVKVASPMFPDDYRALDSYRH